MNICVGYLFVCVPESSQINGVLLRSQQSQVLPYQTQAASSGLHVVQGVSADCSQLAQSQLPQSTTHAQPILQRTHTRKEGQMRTWISSSVFT